MATQPDFAVQGAALPHGAETELQEGLAIARALETPEPAVPEPEEQRFAVPEEEPFAPTTEDDRLLFGPTERTDESLFAGVDEPPRHVPPPDDIFDWLPILRQAAADPNASEQVKAIYRLVAYHLP